MTTTTTNTNPPVDRVRIGNIQASVWRNVDTNDKAYYSIRVDRHYKNREGKWEVTNSYRVDDLPVLAKVAEITTHRVCELYELENGSSVAA